MSINNILKDLGAVQNGEYFILYCPACGKKEAYCYIDDINQWTSDHTHKIPIRCNRLNKCGKTSYMNDYLNKETEVKDIKIKSKNPIQMSYDGVSLLQTYCKYIVDAVHCNTEGFDFGLRGISNQTLKANGIIYNKKSFQSLINQEESKKYFGKKYRSKNYLDRDIIIPIFNTEGIAERILLRSSYYQEKNYKKEIQVMLKQKGCEIWNIKDLTDTDKEIIFITEGVYDALSIKEVCHNPKVGVISLPGVKKYKKVLHFIKKHPKSRNKIFILACDNDVAGNETMDKIKKEFEDEEIHYDVLNLEPYKDCNEFLQKNRTALTLRIHKIIHRRQCG